ncbi:MAG TPA: hypothetical protein VLT82_19015 [Myxococcaceae bacterium]|nr:hypothetical protein [Myxococcaceae bacterium]
MLAPPVSARLVEALVQLHGEGARPRAERGVKQVLAFWRAEDGDAVTQEKFVTSAFIADPALLARTRDRLAEAFEAADGHFLEIGRTWRAGAELERGPELPVDALLAAADLSAHFQEDTFSSRVAFTVLLNWPLDSLEEMVARGPGWSRTRWAEARLAGRLATRPSGAAMAARAEATAAAEAYIAGYNLWVHHLVGPEGQRPFPKGKRLLSHWNLRDQIKADYAEGPEGLVRQRLIRAAMERIVAQDIPRAAIDDPRLDWDPVRNILSAAPTAEVEERPAQTGKAAGVLKVSADREPDTRYALLLRNFQAARRTDQDSPFAPTEMDRRFQLEHEIPEARVRALLESVVASPLVSRVAALIEHRLGRPLEPHDLWYAGFSVRARVPEAKLDALTRKRYPTPEAYAKDMPRLLRALGFTPAKSKWLADRIVVDPARGSGHALQAARRGDFPHLRTRVAPGGMDFKGYNIAVHEMGHNFEQLFSLYEVDSTLLAGVPGNAFTEALAFTFQARDLELLGLGKPSARDEQLRILNDFWATWEIAGVALLDMALWHWMYEHPDATPAQLREATVGLARDLWNRLYAPVLGGKDSAVLGIYSHLIAPSFLYLPAYPLGHLIAFQLQEKLQGPRLGAEFERVASYGRVTPDAWMIHATGEPLSAEPLLRATEAALKAESAVR